MRRAGRRHRHLGALRLRCLPHRESHKDPRRALREACANPLPVAGEKVRRRALGCAMTARAGRNKRLDVGNQRVCRFDVIARRRQATRCAAGTCGLRPSAARRRSRLKGASDHSARASADRVAAKSSTTVTVARPPLPLPLSATRSIRSPDAVRTRSPPRVTLPWFRRSCRSDLPPIVNSSIVEASPRSMTSPAQAKRTPLIEQRAE